MVKLAVFDVDGTLIVKGERTLFDSTVESLKKLQEQGVSLVIASGRPPFYMEQKLIEQVSFDYYICSNGTCILDKDQKRIWQSDISKETVEKISALYKQENMDGMFLFDDGCYAYHGVDHVREQMMKFVGRSDYLRDNTDACDRHLTSLPFANITYIKDESIKAKFEEATPELLYERFGVEGLDVYPKGVNKATGIKHICEIMNISMEDTISFGDDLNDICMLEACGMSVAMGSAQDIVKKSAKYITKSAAEDGVTYALLQLNLIK